MSPLLIPQLTYSEEKAQTMLPDGALKVPLVTPPADGDGFGRAPTGNGPFQTLRTRLSSRSAM